MSQVVAIAPDMTLVTMSREDRDVAIGLAYRITLSPHEWTWTDREQALMARFVLWSHQRLSGIEQLASGELGR